MHGYANVLVAVGSLCLLITLVLAWCLVGVRSSAFMKRAFPSYQHLLKAHIDYLMMTGLLMIFFLLFNHFHASPSPVVVFGMCAGSFMNPIGFIALAMKPTLRQQPNSPFGAIMATSFTLTTIGYAGAAWSIGLAAVRAFRDDESHRHVFGELSRCGFGAYAEFAVGPEKALVLKPSGVSFEEAAAIPTAGCTALQGLRTGRIQRAQRVLIHGASGGVGTFAVQIAKSFGAEVTAVCSTRNVDAMRSNAQPLG